MLNQARQYRSRGDSVVIVTEQAERLENLWAEQDAAHFVPTVQQLLTKPEPGALLFARGSMSEGFSLQLDRGALHCLTDSEIFGWSRPGAAPPPRAQRGDKRARRPRPISWTGARALMWCMSIMASAASWACAIARSKPPNANSCWWNIKARIRSSCPSTKPIAFRVMSARTKNRRSSTSWAKAICG